MPFTMLIKLVSGACNCRCGYCFYADETARRLQQNGVMTLPLLDIAVEKAFAYSNACTFAFQGGEPLLAGKRFYRHLLQKQAQYGGKTVHNVVQTNGTLIDEEWAEIFAQGGFLVGLSLDGPASLHNACRRYNDGGDTYNAVMNAARLLKKYNIPFNILCVVTAQTARRAKELYRFFAGNGFNDVQLVPCLAPLGATSKNTPDAERYGTFLCSLFDEWYTEHLKGKSIRIRTFEDYFAIINDAMPCTCGAIGVCQPQFVLESNGDVYPCDFYALDEYCLGNITQSNVQQLLNAQPAQDMYLSSKALSDECGKCRYLSLCRGGCARYRKNGRHIYCNAYKRFFDYALERMLYIAKR